VDNIVQEALQELFIAITARWRNEQGNLCIGISRKKLLQAGNISFAVLEELIRKIKDQIKPLGLEFLEYIYEGEVWYTVHSTYVAPSELNSNEEAMLAVIISKLETKKDLTTTELKKKLTTGDYFTLYQFDQILKNLEQLGYIKRNKQKIQYAPRNLIEFSPDDRKHIGMEAEWLIF
jgi:hypothetical protein